MTVTNPYRQRTVLQTTATSSSSSPHTISASLTRQLLQIRHPNQRYNSSAITASAELLRLITIEARRRAAIEAECEAEVRVGQSQGSESEDGYDNRKRVEIRAEHVAKIAAELLMDLS